MNPSIQPGHQQHFFAAVCGLHLAERMDRIAAVREYLQLEDREVVRAHQCRRFQAGPMGQAARQPAGRGRLLGGIAQYGTRGVSLSAPGHFCSAQTILNGCEQGD